jgi:alpha-glucosidase
MNFEGERVKDIEDQYMYGRSLMVAPVYAPNATGRYVHLPQCRWLGWTAKKWEERNLQVYEPGDYYIDAPIDRIPLFIKENSMIVLNEPMEYTDQKDITTLYVVAFISKKASFTYILDDGISKDYEDGVSSMLNINISRQDEKYEITIDLDECDEVPIKVQRVFFEIYDEFNELYKEEIEIK